MFLVLDREDESFRGRSHFPLVNRVLFWNGKERFEIDDFAILSLKRFPVSPPWLDWLVHMEQQRCARRIE